MQTVDNLRVGRPHTTPSKPAHTPGVRQGNTRENYQKQPGHLADGRAQPGVLRGLTRKRRIR
jgi:hypothetical protein